MSATAQEALIVAFVFTVGAALYGFGMYAMTGHSSDTPLTVRMALLGLLCATSMLRRRKPMWALSAGLVPLLIDFALGPTIPIWLVYSDLIYASVLYGTRRQSRFVVGAAIAVTAVGSVAAWIISGEWRAMLIALLAASAFVGTSIWWALTVRAHKETAQAERAKARALELVAELDRRAAIADERKTMARDLHDVIAGHLSAIAIQSEAALGLLSRRDDDDPALAGVVESIRSNSVSALQEMRIMIGLLRRDDGAEDLAAPRGLAQLSLLVDAARSAGSTVRVHGAVDGDPLPSAVDQAAYRIIQEALTNAMKHAPGQEVDIDIATEATTLTVAIRNPLPPQPNGSAADPAGLSHRGLTNMRERAAALGGEFAAGPAARVWTVRADLPTTVAVSGGEPR
ncbi:two-component sensor histidine kinase [Nocardia cyriacigeorgica]|uniref:histidine kinase n=1 Tax=Nocardia cyriacigeorgica TaxID=135487 RepID=A0A6P1D467_9NOCA|nr:two-component sensor histidine kinase [Nocardia cyriacigeorgica]NEW43723.1 two-component sensor histidine kinase [Nocardia cyriacigeorgica]NEW49939.1 two-component sensor histidine kinase [Nocardia cyriacigeorgica]NEW54674.1 two-component sensor histidine kinase [Nocardia cyriacigeorgica]